MLQSRKNWQDNKNNMKVLITGAPGTGKTTLSKKLSKELNLPWISLKEFIKEHPRVIEEKTDTGLIIKPELKKLLEKELPEDYIIDTHLIEYTPLTDVVVITRTNPIELKNRLEERGYTEEKIKENLEVEILDYFTQKTKHEKVVEVNTSNKTVEKTVKEVKKRIKKEKWNKGSISWHKKEYLELLN